MTDALVWRSRASVNTDRGGRRKGSDTIRRGGVLTDSAGCLEFQVKKKITSKRRIRRPMCMCTVCVVGGGAGQHSVSHTVT